MDLSSLEGPPTLDDRFTFTISSPSPVSPMGGATWERSAAASRRQQQQRQRQPSIPPTIPQTPISPLSDNYSSRSFSPPGSLPSTLRRGQHRRGSGSDGGFSSYYYTNNYSTSNDRFESPLRSSRSFSSLQEPASLPPRPRSAGSHHPSGSASRPSPRLITNGRLVWLEEQQIWVLVDTPFPQSQQVSQQQQQQRGLAVPGTRDLPRAHNLDTVHIAQHSNNPLIQYYDPITHQDQILQEGGAMPPPSYESHRFSVGRLHPQRISIPAPPPPQHHSDRHPRGARTQWASVAERLGRSPFA